MRQQLWDVPSAWEPARACARAGGTLVLLGASDTGKSTLAVALAEEARQAGRLPMIVDADLGQSTIGPPACVGLARIARPISSLSDLAAEELDFVGSTTPFGNLLNTLAGIQALVRRARVEGAETLIVDTTGLVSGSAGRALKAAKLRLVEADVAIALQRGAELEHLLAPYRTRLRPHVIRLRPSSSVQTRDRVERQEYRQRRFSAYFSAGRAITLDWKRAPVENSPWTAGEPLPGHLRRHAADLLGQEVPYGERGAEGVLLITAGPVAERQRAELETSFGLSRILRADLLDHLLVGLLGSQGETLALGIVEHVDFPTRSLTIFTPQEDAAEVRGLRLGLLQLARDGTQLATVHAAELG